MREKILKRVAFTSPTPSHIKFYETNNFENLVTGRALFILINGYKFYSPKGNE